MCSNLASKSECRNLFFTVAFGSDFGVKSDASQMFITVVLKMLALIQIVERFFFQTHYQSLPTVSMVLIISEFFINGINPGTYNLNGYFQCRHKTSLGYVSEYIQYLSHLNEDNNTRVLFERALSSGSLSAEDSVDVWQQFLEFESSVGDLPGIVKIEKRRAQALDTADVMTTYGETARLIDRYFRLLNLQMTSYSKLILVNSGCDFVMQFPGTNSRTSIRAP